MIGVRTISVWEKKKKSNAWERERRVKFWREVEDGYVVRGFVIRVSREVINSPIRFNNFK